MFEEDFLMSATERNIEKKREEKQTNEKEDKKNEKINFWDVKQSIYEKNKESASVMSDFLN